MAITKHSHLGVELHEREIRIVEVRYRANRPVVVNAGFTTLPSGAHAVNLSQGTGSVAVAVRRLLDTMGVDASQAVFGVAGERSVLRNITVPPVPDSELHVIVAGEVEHYGIVRSRGGAYAFLRHASDSQDQAEPINVSVFAVEEAVTASMREGADKAGLSLEALEPTSVGMLRTILLGAGPTPTVFALMLGTDSSEIAFVKDGALIALRRLDTGSQAMLEPEPEPTRRGTKAPKREDAPDGAEATSDAPALDPGALVSLVKEVRQTIDYVQRDYPAAAAARLLVAVDRAEAAPVVEELAARLDIAVELIGPGPAEESAGPLGQMLASPEGLRYSAAFGLATHRFAPSLGNLPRLDLFATERTSAGQVLVRRNLAGSFAISVAALVLGAVGFFLYGAQISQVDEDGVKAIVRLRTVNDKLAQLRDERTRRVNQYLTLRREGVPIVTIMDYIVQSLEPNVGLDLVTVGTDRHVRVTGETRDEAALIQTVRNLQRSPVLSNLMIGSFAKPTSGSGSGGTFELSCRTVSMEQVRLPGEEKVR